MAHLTNGVVDSLLGVLSSAVKHKAKLLSGVEGDIQFIKDEMDSMNGFLMHLTKKKTHDDQVRAWMKQVRDITYVADDNIKLYMRYLTPPEETLWAKLRYVPVYLRTLRTRHRVAKNIRELKLRVREVGKRRLRYDVKLPDGGDTVSPPPPPPLSQDDVKTREEIRRALEHLPPSSSSSSDQPASFEKAIGMLNCDYATKDILKDYLLKKPVAGDHLDSKKMLLCTVHAYSYSTKEEVESLLQKLESHVPTSPSADWDREVMLFSYSKLWTPYKSCLQYLTTFKTGKNISRTCLVRQWVAEGLLATAGRGEGDGIREWNLEEAGERCFAELVFLGFLSPAPAPAPAAPVPAAAVPTGLKVKCCFVNDPVNNFIYSMSQSENFLSDLPTHLQHQIEIRKLVAQSEPQQQQQKQPWRLSSICCPTAATGHDDDEGKQLPPMDELVKLLRRLPQEYRLNVIDLGGCKALRMCHLRSICKCVPSLKYLSLRNTNVSKLPKEMTDLLNLETLDIRDTADMQAAAMRHIFLQEIKHVLAGCIKITAKDDSGKTNYEEACTVLMPRRIGSKTEVLKHVHIQDDKAKASLAIVGSLMRLRKLGVVLNGSPDNMKYLLHAIDKRSEFLRSLSVWIMEPPPKHMTAVNDGGFVTLDPSDASLFHPPEKLESLNLKCFAGNSTKGRGHIPQWIEGLHLLSKITLRHSQLTKEGLRELGKLKSLRCLKLRRESYIAVQVTLSNGDFPDLRLLVLDHVSNDTSKLEIQTDAAPNLEKIVWSTAAIRPEHNIMEREHRKTLKELNINGKNVLHG